MISAKTTLTRQSVQQIPTVRLDNVELFDVSRVFDCGQCFRFDPVTDSAHEKEFAGCAHGRYISVAQDDETIYIYNSTQEDYEDIWKSFLGLDRDYGEINREILSLSSNPALTAAVSQASGIRILKQDGWEAICSFIISQNNNIPRIKKLIAALCERCGEPIDVSAMSGHVAGSHKNADEVVYSFPSPRKILELGIDGLIQLKTGFRAKYIYDAAQKMLSGEIDIDMIENNPSTAECIQQLCTVRGIGPKVASCALLFGFSRFDAFPVDVWIKKVMEKYFDADFSPSQLGQYAGIAQQYLFYYERYLQS